MENFEVIKKHCRNFSIFRRFSKYFAKNYQVFFWSQKTGCDPVLSYVKYSRDYRWFVYQGETVSRSSENKLETFDGGRNLKNYSPIPRIVPRSFVNLRIGNKVVKCFSRR